MLGGVPRLIATVIGILAAAVAAVVLVGMIDGADPNFSKGRSSTESVIAQEVAGGFALLALGWSIIGCIAVARGKRVGLPLITLVIALVLVVVWLFAYAVERAS
jgi:hypothetical protein